MVKNKCFCCGAVGEIINDHGMILKLRCTRKTCGFIWQVKATVCPCCKQPSGFYKPGLCVECYRLKSESTCKTCGRTGQVIKNKGNDLSMICDECETSWKMKSAICPGCGESNGYPTRGLCKNCYSSKRTVG